MIDKYAFGQNLKSIRKAQGYTGEKFAEAIDISYSFLRQIECGKRMPRVELLVSIANFLECSIDYLLCDSLCNTALSKSMGIVADMKVLPDERLEEIAALVAAMKKNAK